MSPQPRTHKLPRPDDIEDGTPASRAPRIVQHDLAIIDHDDGGYDPYDSSPRFSDNQIEANFGRRKPGLRK